MDPAVAHDGGGGSGRGVKESAAAPPLRTKIDGTILGKGTSIKCGHRGELRNELATNAADAEKMLRPL